MVSPRWYFELLKGQLGVLVGSDQITSTPDDTSGRKVTTSAHHLSKNPGSNNRLCSLSPGISPRLQHDNVELKTDSYSEPWERLNPMRS